MEEKKESLAYWQKRRKVTLEKIERLYETINFIDQKIHAIDTSKV